jgi:hypothetical protein
LYLYAIIVTILMIAKIAGLILALVYKGSLKDFANKTLKEVLDKAIKDQQTAVLVPFQKLEKALECCGATGRQDYPPSMPDLSDQCKASTNPKGCATALVEFVEKNIPIVAGVLGGVIAIELFAIIGAIMLSRALSQSNGARYSSRSGEVMSKFRKRGY